VKKEGDKVKLMADMPDGFDVGEIYQSLLRLGENYLRVGGRLVFLFHTDDEKPAEENIIPSSEAFNLISDSCEGLTKHRARHLITLEKK
jgi:hypothetical protein